MTLPIDPLNFGVSYSTLITYDAFPDIINWFSATDLMELTGLNSPSIKGICLKLFKAGLLDRNADFYPTLYRKKSSKELNEHQKMLVEKFNSARKVARIRKY